MDSKSIQCGFESHRGHKVAIHFFAPRARRLRIETGSSRGVADALSSPGMRALPGGKRVLLAAVVVLIVVGAALIVGRRFAAPGPPRQPVRMRVALTQGRVDEVRRTVEVAM